MYVDECHFNTSERGSVWVTRRIGERFHAQCIQNNFQSGRTSVMIWGGISFGWKSELVFMEATEKASRGGKDPVKKSIAAADYRDRVLIPIVGPAFNGHTDYKGYKHGGLYIEDQAPVHGTRNALVAIKQELGVPLHWRPASSPDLNPIEHIWRIMKQRIKARLHFPGKNHRD